mgnify:CR=1 FL=1
MLIIEIIKKINKKTKAIIPVHLSGRGTNIEKILKIDSHSTHEQIERLTNLKKMRDSDKVTTSFSALAHMASGEGNLIPPILNCIESYCTLGDIRQVFRDIFGEQGGLSDF